MRKTIPTLLCLALLLTKAPAAGAAEIYPMIFPVVGDNHYTDTYNSPRVGHIHEAIDIMAAKMTPVVAVADGVVNWVSGTCCGLQLIHDDGYQSWYIHLNNDTPGTDDGQGWGIAPGIQKGVHVRAGQVIGWVGDSGNAEATASHLHFQLHLPDGTRMNPYESLLAARQIDPAAADEIFFYRSHDGAFRYYDIRPDAGLGAPIRGGTGYSLGWDSITAVDLDGDGVDEQFFYRSTDGAFRYYDIEADGQVGAPMQGGTGYSLGWDSITAVDLNGDDKDEMFFYRSKDGAYRYYTMRPDGSLQTLLQGGTGYSKGWGAITGVDLDGDGRDEMFFYRPTDGAYRYYTVRTNGALSSLLSGGTGYAPGWDSITAIDLNGDARDELFFYRMNGEFAYHETTSSGELGEAILAGSGYSKGWSSISSINLGS